MILCKPSLPRAAVVAALIFAPMSIAVGAAELPTPSLALSFETPEAVKAVFGQTGTPAAGRHGKGVTGLNAALVPAAASLSNTAEGTVTAWVKLEQKPGAGYSIRWLKFSTELALYWGTDKPMLLGVKANERNTALIERGDWHHWAYVWQGENRQLFIDGLLILEGTQPAHAVPPAFQLVTAEGEAKWVADDFRLYRTALSPEQVAAEKELAVLRDAAGALIPSPDGPIQAASPDKVAPSEDVVYGERQLVANPALSLDRHGRAPTEMPGFWRVSGGGAQVRNALGQLEIASDGSEPVSILAELRRGLVRPGTGYQLGLRYSLKKGTGKVLLRFRNQLDMGSREWELPETNGIERRFFWGTAPEDYDVGMYFLEVRVEGAGARMTVNGAYAREASAAEAAANKMQVTAPALDLRAVVKPDESWLAPLAKEPDMLSSALRRKAWLENAAAPVAFDLPSQGTSLLLEQSPQTLWTKLKAARAKDPAAPLQVAVKPPGAEVNGDPLLMRSALGAALLYGVGAAEGGPTPFWRQRMVAILQENGLLDDDAQFIPFWRQSAIYPARAAEKPLDWNAEFAGKPEAPLLGHTATGVLVSGYYKDKKLLLVLANPTAQAAGKMGDVWVDMGRVFNLKTSDSTSVGNLMNRGLITVSEPEQGRPVRGVWNRKGGGYPGNYLFNVAIAPGDFRLLLFEYKG